MIRKIVQVAMVVSDIEEAMRNYWEVWEVGPWEVHTFNPDKIREFTVNGQLVENFEYVIAVTRLGDVQLELIQPIKGPNVYWDFLKQRKGVYIM